MAANTYGSRFALTSFGESHGAALGCVVDGCPAGVPWDAELLAREAARRRPGQKTEGRASVVTDRSESDAAEVLSGVYQDLTLGTPIALLVRNKDQRSEDYQEIAKSAGRSGHADDAWRLKFGHSDPRGGGRSSGRETVARVLGGAVAQMFLKKSAPALRVASFVSQAGPLEISAEDRASLGARWAKGETYPADGFVGRFPSARQEDALETLLLAAKAEGKSYGGVVEIWIEGAPVGLGQPVFRKLKSELASAFMSVGATSGVELGDGFEASEAEGTEFHGQASQAHYGGVRGGISVGGRITARVAFKPTSSVLDVAKKGRHDPCICPRAAPVLESMAWLTLADHVLWARGDRA